MSWFDTSSIANIAKSALKEAQRTIDKALDIQDESKATINTNVPLDTNSENFFDSWSISQPVQVKDTKSKSIEEVVTKSPTKSKLTNSIWGSFSGSFFDYSKENPKRNSIENLDDTVEEIGEEHFTKSKLIVQHSNDDDNVFQSVPLGDKTNDPDMESEKEKSQTSSIQILDEKGGSSKDTSENIENFSAAETDLTRTPDSDLLSPAFTFTSPSCTDQKNKSPSLEILTDSLTSPSSVDILSTDLTNSDLINSLSFCLEFDDNLQIKSDITSPSSVEIIPDNQDEVSVVEDSVSFVSASERTVLESAQFFSAAQDKFSPISESADVVVETQPISSQNTKDNTISPSPTSNVIDIPLEKDENHFDDDGSQSDRTIIASTENIMESSSDTASTSTEQNVNSSLIKSIISDVVHTEKSPGNISDKSARNLPKKDELMDMSISQLEMREVSSVSSESRSDLVKVESDQASGHTSGDEIETTTSSDIEIISSPNGDSSSTHSRHSPAKISCVKQKCPETNIDALLGKMTFKKIKGHNRELSEASSVSDDSSEVDRLLKRLNEVTEILEYRETKLIEVNRNNAEIQETNHNLQKQLDALLTQQMESVDVSQVTEEYTKRMSILEKKFQQAIKEKDDLNKQVEQLKHEASNRISKGDFDSLLAEKENLIKELREEGEKLSKQQLQQSNIIKKLRAKEKENENTLKKLRENLEDLNSENERLKKSLSAKDEVEHSQIEAVHHLTAKNNKLEYEVSQLQSQVEDTTQKYETVKKSLDAAKIELAQKTRTHSEMQHKQQILKTLEDEKRMTESQNEEIISQIEDLRLKLQESDQEMVKREQLLKKENTNLLRRLEEAERRNEELAQSLAEASKPLVRQLEALQANHSEKIRHFEKIEQELTWTINELKTKLHSAISSENIKIEECQKLNSKVSMLESKLSSTEHQFEMLKVNVEQIKTEKMILEQELKREIEVYKTKLNDALEIMNVLQKEKQNLEQQLASEKSTIESLKRKNSLQESIHGKGDSLGGLGKGSPSGTRNTSPTISVGRASVSESLASSVFLLDDQMEIVPSRFNNILELQMLQTSLKQKEGEAQQLQWELNRREHERTLLNKQISTLLIKVEALEKNEIENKNLRDEFENLQKQYDTLCQLYGEKVEEAEELKLDLQDVKEAYKSQLDELLNQAQEK